MSLIEQIQTDLKESLKQGNTQARDALRLLLAQLKNAAIAQGQEMNTLSDDAVVAVVRKEIKKRDDALLMYEQGGREELAAQEKSEKALYEQYAPALATEGDIKAAVEKVIAELGATAQFGQVMQAVMKELQGNADGKVVNAVVRSVLDK